MCWGRGADFVSSALYQAFTFLLSVCLRAFYFGINDAELHWASPLLLFCRVFKCVKTKSSLSETGGTRVKVCDGQISIGTRWSQRWPTERLERQRVFELKRVDPVT